MDIMSSALLTVHILVGLGVIALVLLQHGKGADMGAAFGSGSSGSLFGATGAANFLSRATALLATVFFITSLGLAYVGGKRPVTGGSIVDSVKVEGSVPVTVGAPPALPVDSKARDIPK
jgi:preprotein translocase subunit SecG